MDGVPSVRCILSNERLVMSGTGLVESECCSLLGWCIKYLVNNRLDVQVLLISLGRNLKESLVLFRHEQ